MDELTPRQRQVLRFIQEAVFQQGMPPTRAEIAEALGFKSANAAEEHLRALQRKGVLDLKPGASRGIQLRDSLREAVVAEGIRKVDIWTSRHRLRMVDFPEERPGLDPFFNANRPGDLDRAAELLRQTE